MRWTRLVEIVDIDTNVGELPLEFCNIFFVRAVILFTMFNEME